MSKAFLPEDTAPEAEESEEAGPPLPAGEKNYITPKGFQKLQSELEDLLYKQRPELTAVVAWAAGNGDRSENADYIYGKRRLREIDRRIRFLQKRLEAAEVVDPKTVKGDRVFFGATVTIENEDGESKTYSIVGIDEADPGKGKISWISPLARVLLKAKAGDSVSFRTPGGTKDIEVVAIEYAEID